MKELQKDRVGASGADLTFRLIPQSGPPMVPCKPVVGDCPVIGQNPFRLQSLKALVRPWMIFQRFPLI
jgi:hypothetical protein